jgi:hypothetical protein
MPGAPAIDRLWDLVSRPGGVDARALLHTVADASRESDDDPRTRLLMRDASRILQKHFGDWLVRRHVVGLDSVCAYNDGDDRGFPTLEARVVDATNPDRVLQMFTELGKRIRGSATLIVGGSLPLILNHLIVRKTDDADIVDEVPAVVREQHDLLAELAADFGLRLSHFQSHYLPEGWRDRLQSLGRFGQLDVMLIDPIDVLVGKLFTRRDKDFRDIRVAFSLVDRQTFTERVRRSTSKLREEPAMLAAAVERWGFLTGEDDLPT